MSASLFEGHREGVVLLALLIAGHCLADFVFQSRSMVEGKRTSARALLLHGLEVFVVQACVLLPFAGGRGLVCVLIVAGAHLPIDRAKIWLETRFGTRLLWFALDQLMHAVVILATAMIWSASVDPGEFGPVIVEPRLLAGAAWIVAAYAFAVNGGGAVVTAVLENLRRAQPPSSRPNPQPGAPGAGHLIGILERLILVTLVWQGEWGAIGFVLAAKSVARFKELEERPFAEIYLVGTLTSFLVAGALGLFLRSVL